MAKLRLPSTSRRGFLRRSPLFLASLLLAACRRPLDQARDRVTGTSAQTVANSTSQAQASSTELALTPACGDSSVPSGVTPAQTPGPFYSPNSPQRQSLLEADTSGTQLTLTGQVLGQDCQPLANCLVDFWQADDQGNYDNDGYRLRGHQFTDSEGRYHLETVVPGIYPGRTRHLHVRVQPGSGSGIGPMLTTQLYLPNEPLNAGDFLFQPELLMAMQDSPAGKQAQFNFVVEAPANAQTKEEAQ
jgi:protocatechuate 3,4-dioxygenase beta subunit